MQALTCAEGLLDFRAAITMGGLLEDLARRHLCFGGVRWEHGRSFLRTWVPEAAVQR